ncbi:MAG: hypothetical protein JNL32_10960 [Candidatus Kapabacteria bacterium]|nr:hypothetical protein [Candidatus Kapabacteria bacterium]
MSIARLFIPVTSTIQKLYTYVMSKFIIGAFLVVTVFFLLMYYVKGAIRRLFGVALRGNPPNRKDEVLYEQNGTTVMRGESKHQQSK